VIDGIWPLVLISLVVVGALGMASVLLFSRSRLKSSKVTLWVALVGVFLVITPTLYESVKKPEAYVFVKCNTTSETAPSTVSCEAIASEYDSIQWSINDEIIEGFSGLNFEREIEASGEYKFEVQLTNKNFFREAISSFSAQVVIAGPLPPEPELIEVKQPFSETSLNVRSFRFVFPPKPGFKIIDARLENVRKSQAYGVRVLIENGVAVVSGTLKPKQYFKGFAMRVEPAKVTGLVVMTQMQEQ
jgi:hypothetical protein